MIKGEGEATCYSFFHRNTKYCQPSLIFLIDITLIVRREYSLKYINLNLEHHSYNVLQLQLLEVVLLALTQQQTTIGHLR